MIRGCQSAALADELRLPPGWHVVNPSDPPEIEEGMRVEIMDLSGQPRRWEWPEVVHWHEALGYRIADDGVAEACGLCGTLTHQVDMNGDALCMTCCTDGDWEHY